MERPNPPTGNMTVREFMDWSRIGRTKTYEEIRAGRLGAFKVGRKTLISYADALQWSWNQPRFVNWATPHDVYGYPEGTDDAS